MPFIQHKKPQDLFLRIVQNFSGLERVAFSILLKRVSEFRISDVPHKSARH